MKLTPIQHKIFRELGMSKVFNKPLFKATPSQLGYTYRARRSYDITIADDLGDSKVRAIVLLHEIAHIFLGHMDENIPQELKNVKTLIKGMGVNYTKCMLFFGGPMTFLNIAMDLECNTKILTPENIKYVDNFLEKESEGKLCTPEKYETVEKDKFRDYYIPLVEYFKKHESEMKISFTNAADGDLGISVSDVMNGLEDDEEIKELLEESGYQGGNDKNDKDINKSKSSSNVEDEYEDIDSLPENGREEKYSQKKKNSNDSNKQAGRGRSCNNVDISTEDPDKEIANFLTRIVRNSLEYKHDSFRHYNRGTRRSKEGVFYSSLKRKSHSNSRILSIVTDISGSINTSQLATAVQSVKLVFNKLHPSSELATCDTKICKVYPITNIPNVLNCGGGTDMAVGLKYFVDKNAQDIVLYSDLETDMYEMNKIIDNNPNINFYTIVTGRSQNINDFTKDEYYFLSKNKRVLLLNN